MFYCNPFELFIDPGDFSIAVKPQEHCRVLIVWTRYRIENDHKMNRFVKFNFIFISSMREHFFNTLAIQFFLSPLAPPQNSRVLVTSNVILVAFLSYFIDAAPSEIPEKVFDGHKTPHSSSKLVYSSRLWASFELEWGVLWLRKNLSEILDRAQRKCDFVSLKNR